MNAIYMIDGSLKLSIYHEVVDSAFDDDICLRFQEDCPEDEKLFKADEICIYLTPEEAALVVLEINRALDARQLARGANA
jgi:hypothetical protein